MRKIALALLFAVSLSGCAQVERVVTAVTQEITNPLGEVDIYRVKNVYAASLQLAVEYRKFCWSKPYAELMADPVAKPVCQSRRPIVRQMQAAKANASAAIKVADNFIRANPTGNAVSYVRAAWDAVKDFKAAVPAVN